MKRKEMGFFLEAINDTHTEIYDKIESLFGRRGLKQFLSDSDTPMAVFKRDNKKVGFLKQGDEPREMMILVGDKTIGELRSQAVIYIQDIYQKKLEIIEWEENFDFDLATASKELLEWIKEVKPFDS